MNHNFSTSGSPQPQVYTKTIYDLLNHPTLQFSMLTILSHKEKTQYVHCRSIKLLPFPSCRNEQAINSLS